VSIDALQNGKSLAKQKLIRLKLGCYKKIEKIHLPLLCNKGIEV
jgi:hypothetical protein